MSIVLPNALILSSHHKTKRSSSYAVVLVACTFLNVSFILTIMVSNNDFTI